MSNLILKNIKVKTQISHEKALKPDSNMNDHSGFMIIIHV